MTAKRLSARIHKGEWSFVVLMFIYWFAVITTFWILKPIKKALFIDFYNVGGHTFDLFGWVLSGPQAEMIAKIGNMPVRNWYSATQNFEIEIEITPGGPELRPNVSAEAEILVKQLKDVLHVPISAVFTHDGRDLVYVEGSRATAREVVLGQANDTRAEIRSGLEEGEEVLLYEPEGAELPEKTQRE